MNNSNIKTAAFWVVIIMVVVLFWTVVHGKQSRQDVQLSYTNLMNDVNAGKIKTPLLIIQGANDPRVPATQAATIVAATKDRVPVWYILAKDEGHGFSQQSNRDYKLYASILFVKEFLLK